MAKHGGRQKGTPNRITQNLVKRLDELGCDPLELSARIAIGQELDGPHPALGAFREFARKLSKIGVITDAAIEELTALIDDNLTKGYVPIDLRSKHIADLMRYIYPQRRAVDVKAEIDDKRTPKVDPSKLSDEALKQLVGARVGEAVGEVVEAEVVEDDDDADD